jgi:hypothetical protein
MDRLCPVPLPLLCAVLHRTAPEACGVSVRDVLECAAQRRRVRVSEPTRGLSADLGAPRLQRGGDEEACRAVRPGRTARSGLLARQSRRHTTGTSTESVRTISGAGVGLNLRLKDTMRPDDVSACNGGREHSATGWVEAKTRGMSSGGGVSGARAESEAPSVAGPCASSG